MIIFRRAQRGFTLLEVGIAIAISMMAATAFLWVQTMNLRVSKANAQGTQLTTLSNAVATYMTTYYSQLVNNQAIAGFANIYAPTVAELKTAQIVLPPNFSATNLYGGGYAVTISKTPGGCVSPNCDISSITNLTNAITNPLTGRVDGAALGNAMSVIGADGGFSTNAVPGSITGQGGAWTATNPAGSVAGILAMRAGYGSSGWAQFLRRDGQLPMTGPLNMGSQNVNNANTVNSTTLANSGNATVGGTLGVTGQTSTNGIANTGSLSTGNTTENGTATVTGNTSLGGTLAVTGYTNTNGLTNAGNLTNTGDVSTGKILLNTIVGNGSSCVGLNGFQASTAAGSIVSCINGVWQTPSGSVQPPSPCNATSVNFGGCSGNLPYTLSGQNASATMTYGTGNATYSCNNGSFSLVSYQCTPPPASCNGTSVSFGSGCSGSIPFTSSGNTASANVTTGSGFANYLCTNGSWSLQSFSCTPPAAGCGAQTVSWSVSASCSGSVSSLSSGSGQWVNATNGNNGSVFVSCNNGSLSQSSASCTAATTVYTYPTTAEGYYLASNPTARAQWCNNVGKTPSASGQIQTDYGGSGLTFCHTIDSSNHCIPGASGSCTAYQWGNPGCWIQSQLTCQ